MSKFSMNQEENLLMSLFAAIHSPSTTLAISDHKNVDKIKETVQNYLSDHTNYIYLYKEPETALITPTLLALDATESQPVVFSQENAFTNEDALISFHQENLPELMREINYGSLSLKTMLSDLQQMDDLAHFRKHVGQTAGYAYSSFKQDLYFGEITFHGNGLIATVDVTEELNYQYVDCDEPSYEQNVFNFVLVKIGSKWVIVDTVTDTLGFIPDCKEGVLSLDDAIKGVDEARKEAALEKPVVLSASDIAVQATTSDISYNKQNAVNYVLTYTTDADAGKHGTQKPTFRNERFPWFNADCMNLCSQAIWAGFGGSNSWTDIPAKRGMDSTGSAIWYCTEKDGSPSWKSCSSFRTYLTNVSSDTTGIVCARKSVAYNSNQLPYSASELVGAVLHVRGMKTEEDGTKVPVEKGHAVFVNAATGNTRDSVYICAYNSCRKNVKLGEYFPSSTSDKTCSIEVMIPQKFTGGKPAFFICGYWQNVVATKTKSVTLNGFSNVSVTSFKMELLKPDGSTAKTWTSTNTTSVSGTYNNWNVNGEWIMKLTATNSSGTTLNWYCSIRVAVS